MMSRCALLFLLLPACVSRTTVGAELALNEEAGADSRTDGGADDSDALLDPEQEAIRDFQKDLIGSWFGELTLAGILTQPTGFVFGADSVYTFCTKPKTRCSAPGLYFVTDQLSNGHFAGELHNVAMDRTLIEDMWIERGGKRDILHFWLRNGGLSFEAVLPRVE